MERIRPYQESKLAEYLDSTRNRSIGFIIRRGLNPSDAEDCVQDACLHFETHLRRQGMGVDPFAWDALWWRILKQCAVKAWGKIDRRGEQPFLSLDADGDEITEESYPGREHERPQEHALLVKESNAWLREFLRKAETQSGGKVVKALAQLAQQAGAETEGEVLAFLQAYLFHNSAEWVGPRRRITRSVAEMVACSPEGVYTATCRIKKWWKQLKHEALNGYVRCPEKGVGQ